MSENTSVEFEGQLKFQEYLLANYWFLFHKFKFFIAILFFAGVVYPALFFAGILGDPNKTSEQSNWGFIFAPSFIVLIFLGTYLSARRHFQSNKGLSQSIHFIFSSMGIEASGPLSSGRSSWETIRNAYETRRSFLLFISNNQMYTIPKRFMAGEGEITQFRKMLKINLDERAKM
jgi:hypothetical protein